MPNGCLRLWAADFEGWKALGVKPAARGLTARYAVCAGLSILIPFLLQKERPLASLLEKLLPRDRTFWLYHSLLLLFITLINGATILAWGEKRMFDIASHVVWLPAFTLGVLWFRYHCQRYHWHCLSIGVLIAIGLAYALVIAIGSTFFSLAFTLPIFWDYLFSADFLAKFHTTIGHQLGRLASYGTLSSFLFACAWIFIYISILIGMRARQAELDKLRLENGLKQAQITSLTHQLNPHFLFNSLNNIRFLIYESPALADRTITALSEILRYSLDSGKRTKVTLGEEIAIVRRYVDIVSVQMEERLIFDLVAEETLNNLLIPPMTLQLLVENAVKHGLDHISAPATLSVRAEVVDRHFCLTVENPLHCQGERRDSIGLGLPNIQQRLRLLYGEEATMRTHASATQFTAILTLPQERL